MIDLYAWKLLIWCFMAWIQDSLWKLYVHTIRGGEDEETGEC